MTSDLQRQFIDASALAAWEHKRRQELWDHDRLQAAMFLGALQQANGCELEEIVRAANRACIGHACGADAIAAIPDHDIREFARILTLQALGEPVRWEDEHAAFTVQRGLQDWRLVVPSIRLERETVEVEK